MAPSVRWTRSTKRAAVGFASPGGKRSRVDAAGGDCRPLRPGQRRAVADLNQLIGSDVIVRECTTRKRHLAVVVGVDRVQNRAKVQWYNDDDGGAAAGQVREVYLTDDVEWINAAEIQPQHVVVCRGDEQQHLYSLHGSVSEQNFGGRKRDREEAAPQDVRSALDGKVAPYQFKPDLGRALVDEVEASEESESLSDAPSVPSPTEPASWWWATVVCDPPVGRDRPAESSVHYGGVCVRSVDFFVQCSVRYRAQDGTLAIGRIVDMYSCDEDHTVVLERLDRRPRHVLRRCGEEVNVFPTDLIEKVWVITAPDGYELVDWNDDDVDSEIMPLTGRPPPSLVRSGSLFYGDRRTRA